MNNFIKVVTIDDETMIINPNQIKIIESCCERLYNSNIIGNFVDVYFDNNMVITINKKYLEEYIGISI